MKRIILTSSDVSDSLSFFSKDRMTGSEIDTMCMMATTIRDSLHHILCAILEQQQGISKMKIQYIPSITTFAFHNGKAILASFNVHKQHMLAFTEGVPTVLNWGKLNRWFVIVQQFYNQLVENRQLMLSNFILQLNSPYTAEAWRLALHGFNSLDCNPVDFQFECLNIND
jgi:hypothetical protein